MLDYLRVGVPEPDEILRHVTLETLYESSAFATLAASAKRNGELELIASFGFSSQAVEAIPKLTIQLDAPLPRSIRTEKVIDSGNFEDYVFAAGAHAALMFPNGFKSSFAWPVAGVGACVTYCNAENEMTPDFQEFLVLVGSIIASELSTPARTAKSQKQYSASTRPLNLALTSRQWLILEGLKKESSNQEIAKDLGFSESLVRQEAIKIYRKLGLSGKRDLISFKQELPGK